MTSTAAPAIGSGRSVPGSAPQTVSRTPFVAVGALSAMLLVAFLSTSSLGLRSLLVTAATVLALGTQANLLLRWRPPMVSHWYWVLLTEALYGAAAVCDGIGFRPSIGPLNLVAILSLLAFIGLLGPMRLIGALPQRWTLPIFADTATLLLAAFAVVWVIIMDPGQIAARSVSTVGQAPILYAVLDILVLSLAVRPALQLPWREFTSLMLLLGGLVGVSLADIVPLSAAEVLAGVRYSNVFALITFLFMALAAVHPTVMAKGPLPVEVEDSALRLPLPVLGVAVCLPPLMIVLLGSRVGELPVTGWVLVVTSVLVFLLVMTRLSSVVRLVDDQTEKLAGMARTDHLTSLPNRRTTDAELDRVITSAIERGNAAACALIDIDHFKLYNDTFGHPAGDKLLSTAASAWRMSLPPDVFLGRFGGEEFVVIFPGHDPSVAVDLLGRMREVTPMGQTFSGGLAFWDGLESPMQLVRRADQALYDAKASGRNRTVIYHRGLAAGAPQPTLV